MRTPKILLVYKLSSLSVAGKLSSRIRHTPRFQANHQAHYASLRAVESILKERGLKYQKRTRSASGKDKGAYGLIITVGGDGTLLDAARGLGPRQILLGVNSDPRWSVGQFCCCNASNFSRALERVLAGKADICKLYKLKLRLQDGKISRTVECLNDALICHANPAAMSRYSLRIGNVIEDHRSSGMWFSTAAGSTGAMLSAGGRRMPLTSKDIQYRTRELYRSRGTHYRLTGGMIAPGKKASLTSMMPRGRIFVDGAHVKFPFTYGSHAEISVSSACIKLVHG